MTRESFPNSALLYLGSKGGGAKFNNELAALFRFKTHIINKNLCDNLTNLSNPLCIRMPNRAKLLTYIFSIRLLAKNYLAISRKIKTEEITHIIIPMSNPWEVLISYLLQRKGVRIIRFIHDSFPHEGDYWPTKRTIKRLITRSDVIVALNPETYMYAKSLRSDSTYFVNLPVQVNPLNLTRREIQEKYVLIIGRMKKYKGINEFIELWDSLDIKDDFKLLVAGVGNLNILENENIIVISRWLPDNEFHSLIQHAEAIVFPYREASQSGIMPIAAYFGKKIIISKNANLIYQAKSLGINHFILPDLQREISSFDLKNYLSKKITDKEIENSRYEIIKSWREIENLIRESTRS